VKTKGMATVIMVIITVIVSAIAISGIGIYLVKRGTDTTLPVDTTPPVITNVSVVETTQNSATISWRTDEPSDSKVRYGTSYPITTAHDSIKVKDHWIYITGLASSTKYYFEVVSTDNAGNYSRSPDNPTLVWTFTTKPPSSQSLVVGNTAITSETEVTVTSAEAVTSYTRQSGGTEMSPAGKIFVIIDAKIKYTGTTSKYVSAGDFSLVGSGSVKYEYASGTYSSEGGFEGATLSHNQEHEGKILFEVPEGTSGLKAQADVGTYLQPETVTWELGLVTSYKILAPIADAHVEPGNNQNSNYGGNSWLDLDSTYYTLLYTLMGPSTKAYIKFDLTTIPSGVTINSATLRLRCLTASETIGVRLYYCSDDTWTETGITWNNAPSKGELVGAVTVSSTDWYSWDVTQIVNGAISKGKLSLELEMNLDGITQYRYISTSFYSKEGSYSPRLEIAYT
jgi:hypothetical protein